MFKFLAKYIFFYGICIAFGSNVYAFTISPFSATLSPSGRLANYLFTLKNTDPIDKSIAIAIYKRSLDMNGKETLTDAQDDFVLYPEQLILPANKEKGLRLQYIGNPRIDKEIAYRLIVEQLPINVDKTQQQSQINLLLRYEPAIYVAPDGVKAEIAIDSVVQTLQNNKSLLSITLVNKGKEHKVLKKLAIHLQDNQNNKVTLSDQQLKDVEGINLLAESKRNFVLPWPKELKTSTVSAELMVD